MMIGGKREGYAVLFNTIVHTDVISSYRWTVLGFGFWVCFCVLLEKFSFCVFRLSSYLVVFSVPVQLFDWRLVCKIVLYGMLNPAH